MNGDKMTERMVSRIELTENDVDEALKWAWFVQNNSDKFKKSLDFAIELLEKANLIGSRYHIDEFYYFFFRDETGKHFYDLARLIGDDARATKIEKIIKETEIVKQHKEWDWTQEQALKEWENFVKENEEKFKELIYFLREKLLPEPTNPLERGETGCAARHVYGMACMYEDFSSHYAEFAWKRFLDDNRGKLMGFLDFAIKFLKQASLISSHYDKDESYSLFVRKAGKYFYDDLARLIGDDADARAKEIEKIIKETEIVKQRKEWDWTQEQALKEWENFVEKNKEKFLEFLILGHQLREKAEPINQNFANESRNSLSIIWYKVKFVIEKP